jgi:hypothetical protein
MKTAKLILLTSPALVASMLLIAKPVEASIANAPTQQHLTLPLDQPVSAITLNSSQESNPIKEQMGCNCSTCVQAKVELLQGKLPISSIL